MATPTTIPADRATEWSFVRPGVDATQTALFNLTRQRGNLNAIAMVERGLPRSAFDRLQRALGVPQKEAADAVMIPIRTLSRRQRLRTPESDRVFRFALLFQRAIEIMGDGETARRWMQAPKKALGGETPMRHARTEIGARHVERLLGQIEHGVFS